MARGTSKHGQVELVFRTHGALRADVMDRIG